MRMLRLALVIMLALLPALAWSQCETGWATGTAVTHASYRAVGGYWEGNIYLIGGTDNVAPSVSDTQIYNIADETWESGADLPTVGDAMCGGVYAGKIYLFGGYTDSELDVTQIYDIANDTWDMGAVMPFAIAGCQAGAIDGVFYVAGGVASDYTAGNTAYDIAEDTWDASVVDLPATQAYGAGAVDDSLFYVLDGRVGGQTVTAVLNAYDPNGDTWASLTADASARYNPGLTYAEGKLYAIFGGGSGGDEWDPWSTCEVYDVAGDTWATLDSPSDPGLAPLTAYAPDNGGLLFAIGGVDINVGVYATNRIYSLCLAQLESITPASAEQGVAVEVIIAGYGFEATDTAYLTDSAKTEYGLTDIFVDDGNTISATLPDTLPAGVYSLVVESASGEQDVLADGFEVTAPGDDDDDDDDDSGCCG